MSPHVKELVRDYLQEVDLKTIKKDFRISLIKECIKKLNMLEKIGLLDKIKLFYPMVGTTEPVVIKKFKK